MLRRWVRSRSRWARALLAGAVCMLQFASHADSPALIDPGIPNMERSVYRLTKEGGVLSSSIHYVTRVEQDGEPVYQVKTADKTMLLRRRNLTPLRITQWKRPPDEEQPVEWEILYSEDRVNYIFPGPKRNKVEKVDENRYDVNAIVHVVRGFPFGKTDEVKVTLVTHDHRLGVYFKIEGRETVTAPVGEFDCYKLKAGLTGYKGRIYRKNIYFWVEAAAPHRLIRQVDEGITDVRMSELAEYGVGPEEVSP